MSNLVHNIQHWLMCNWMHYLSYIELAIIAYDSIMRGNMTNVVVCSLFAYLSTYLTTVSAYDLNVTIAPATFIKTVRCNAIWFLNYNFVDQYVMSEIIDTSVNVTLLLFCYSIMGVVLTVLVVGSVKFLTQHLNEMTHMDSLSFPSKELRYPSVLSLARYLGQK